jgi:hypothetical protein
LQPRQCRVGERTSLRHDGLVGTFGHGDEDLRQVDFQIARSIGALLLDDAVDVDVGDADARSDLALTHPLQQHLVAQVVAELRVVHPFGLQSLAQLWCGELVLRSDVGHGTIQFDIVDAVAAFARVSQQHPLLDQRIEGLLAQAVVRGHLQVGALSLGTGPKDALLHLDRSDGFGVDHRHDVVAIARRLRALRHGRHAQAQSDERGKERAQTSQSRPSLAGFKVGGRATCP